MRRDEVRELFREYVFGFIKNDIEREIWLAGKAQHDETHGAYPGPHPGGGNLLAALGLVCYTEFLGELTPEKHTTGEQEFTAFLYRMGANYEAFDKELRAETGKSVCDIYRNGLAHEYFVKRDCTIYMRSGTESCGIGKLNGRYYFVVERYLADFLEASRNLQEELLRRATA